METPFGYVDPIYIVIAFLIVVGIFMLRLDARFGKIELLLKGVKDASENTSKNSDHLPAIAGNTGPMSRDEISRTRSVLTDGTSEPASQSLNALDHTDWMQHGQPK